MLRKSHAQEVRHNIRCGLKFVHFRQCTLHNIKIPIKISTASTYIYHESQKHLLPAITIEKKKEKRKDKKKKPQNKTNTAHTQNPDTCLLGTFK